MGRTKRKWNKRAKQHDRSRPLSNVSEWPPSRDRVEEDYTSGINLEASQLLDIRLARDSGTLRAQIDDYAEKLQGMVLDLKGLLQTLQALKEEETTRENTICKVTNSLEEIDKLDRRGSNAKQTTLRLNDLSLNSTPRASLPPLISQGSSILNSITFERYDGIKDFNIIHDWLYAFEAYWKMIPILEEERVKFAALHLRGTAAIIWCKHIVKAQQGLETMISDWKQFRNWIMHNFLPFNYVNQTRTEWRNLRQNNNTVRQYAELLESCLLKVPDTVDESEQVHHFLLGLRREIRQEVKATKPTTLANAIFQAQIIEEKLQSKKNTISKVNEIKEEKNSRSKKKFNEFTTLDYLTPMCPQKQVQFKWLTDKEKDEYRKLGMCYVCKKTGHTTFKCPEKVERQRSNALKTLSYQDNVEGNSVENIDNIHSIERPRKLLDEDTTHEKESTQSVSEYDLLRMRYGILNVRHGR